MRTHDDPHHQDGYVVLCKFKHWQRCEMSRHGGFHPVAYEVADDCAKSHASPDNGNREAVVVHIDAVEATLRLLNG